MIEIDCKNTVNNNNFPGQMVLLCGDNNAKIIWRWKGLKTMRSVRETLNTDLIQSGPKAEVVAAWFKRFQN